MYARIIPSELWKNSWDFNNSMERVEVPFFIKQFEFLDNSLRGSTGVRSYECHEYAPNSCTFVVNRDGSLGSRSR